jgi:carboxymethylenebutenolidase
MSQIIALEADGSPMEAYIATSKPSGRCPGVIVSPHQYGLSPFTRGVVDSLAAIGCTALAIDPFHHCPPEDDMEAKKARLTDARTLEDFSTAIRYLQDHSEICSDRIAVLGHCMGGRTAFLAASHFPVLKGAVVYYSGGMFMSRGGEAPTAFERLKEIKCPVIGFFGTVDKNPSPDDVTKMDAELTRYSIPHSFHSYPGAGHGFCDATIPKQYNAEGAIDSWSRTVDFLSNILGAEVRSRG